MQSEGTNYGYSYGYGAFPSAPYSAPLQFPPAPVGYGALRGYPNSSTVSPLAPSDFQAANPVSRPPDVACSFYESSAAQSRGLKRPRQEEDDEEGDGGSETATPPEVVSVPQPVSGLGAPHTSLFRPIDFEGGTSNFDDAVQDVKRTHRDVSRSAEPQTHYLPTPPQSERGVSPPDSLSAASPAPQPPSHGVTVSLSNDKVWESFAAVGNEMIVTKLGR